MAVVFQQLSSVNATQEDAGRWKWYELAELSGSPGVLGYGFAVNPLDPVNSYWDYLGHYSLSQSVNGIQVSRRAMLLPYFDSMNPTNLIGIENPPWFVPDGVDFRPGVALNIYDSVGAYRVRWFAIITG